MKYCSAKKPLNIEVRPTQNNQMHLLCASKLIYFCNTSNISKIVAYISCDAPTNGYKIICGLQL